MGGGGGRFEFEFSPAYRRAALVFGITERTAHIDIVNRSLRVRFGPWRVEAALDNVASMTRTGPYAFVRTAGPARLGLSDRSLTFATNSQSGVQIDFTTPITGIDPLRLIRHPSLTLTPTDPDALIRALRSKIRDR